MLLYATFPSGMRVPVLRLVCNPVQILDGAVLYESGDAPENPWANNTFEVLSWERGKLPLNQFIKKTIKNPPYGLTSAPVVRKLKKSCGHFRIVTSEENKLVSVDPNIKKQMEALIASKTGLAPNREGSGREYWFLSRSEGFTFFMERLTYHKTYDKALPKGALTPPLAYLLHICAEPVGGDVLLDPFCGTGAIGTAARYFPYAKVLESDRDISNYRTGPMAGTDCSPPRFAKEKPVGDLLSWLAPGSVNKIVTDPPWGLHEVNTDIKALYSEMLDVFARVVAPGGLIVLLAAQKDLIAGLISNKNALSLRETHSVLVSGKKAGVFVVERL